MRGETRTVRERVTDGIRFDSDAGARESTTRGRRGTTTTRAANGTAMKVSGEDEDEDAMRCDVSCAMWEDVRARDVDVDVRSRGRSIDV